MALAVVLYVAVAAGAIELGEGAGPYQSGRALGAAMAGLMIAAVIRLIYVRLTPWGRGKPDVAPALFYLAAGISALSIVVHTAGDSAAEQYAAGSEDCTVSEPNPFTGLPPGVTLAELPPEGQAQLEALMAATDDAGITPDRVEAKLLVAGGRTLGYTITIPGMPEDERDEYEAGFTDSVAGRGGTVERATIAGQRVLVGQTEGLAAVAGTRGCWAMGVYGPDRETSEALAEALLRG